jgi:trimeric autotransporter adhesin
LFPQFNRVQIDKAIGNSLTLNTRVNVATLIDFKTGLINTTSTNILNLANNTVTTIGNANSYVNGPMYIERNFDASATLLFAIGKGSAWRPVELTVAHSFGGASNITYKAEMFNNSARALNWTLPGTIDKVSGMRYWDIERLATATYTATNASISGNQTVRIYYGVDDVVSDPTNLTIVKNIPTALTEWKDIGGVAVGAPTGYVTSTSAPFAFNNYSRFTLGNRNAGSNVLPINNLRLVVEGQRGFATLNFTNLQEVNVSSYEILKSADGISYSSIGFKAANNSTMATTYSHSDYNLFAGNNFYKIKMIHSNGAVTFSNVVSYNQTSTLTIFPNPTTNSIKFSTPVINTWIEIYDTKGQVVLRNKVVNSEAINVANLPVGNYYIKLVNTKQVIGFIKK